MPIAALFIRTRFTFHGVVALYEKPLYAQQNATRDPSREDDEY